MAYITARDLRAVVPDQYRDAALADTEGGQPDPGLLSAVIEAACTEVDALIEGRVRLPFSVAIPGKIKTAALYIALETLFVRRGVEMPEALARKVSWWRDWLSKVGEGELRATAPDVPGSPTSTSGGTIVSRPSVMGSGGMIGCLLAAVLSLALRADAAISPRDFSFSAPATNLIDSADYLEWSQGETVRLRYTLLAQPLAAQDLRWEITDRSNLWVNAEPSVSGRTSTWTLPPTNSVLPAGRYEGRVAAYTRSGTNLTFHRVLAWQDIRVHAARDPASLIVCSPIAAIEYFATTGALAEATASAQSNLAAHADNTDNPHGVTAEQIGALTAETDAAALSAIASVSGRVDTVEGWGDHAEAGYALSSALLGYLPSAQAATQYLSVAAAASAYQPLGAYGTETNTAYRGDWGASVSNLAAQAAGWGDHAAAGYLTAESDTAALSAVSAVSGRVDVVESWGDHAEAGYLTAETDPAFAAAPAYGITTDLIAAWNLAYGWGNHASAGYLTNESDPAGIAALGMFSNSVFSIMNDMSSDIVYAVSLAEGASTGSEPLWTAASNSVLYVGDVADVAYGTATDEAYRGDWGAAVSNAAVLRSIATVPVFDAYSAPASESLPFVVTNTGVLTLSGLTSGSIGIRLTTTNASGIALYAVVVKDGDGETIATINPACDGTEQSARWPWNASETLTIEATGIASPVEGAESAIITAAQVETWADVSLVGKTNDLADQHLYVDYPAATNEAANRAYADDAADAALALALGEIGTATFNRDLAGFVQRWNPRFDSFAASNSLTTLYAGSTALRLDGEGAAVVPEIKAFSVEAGTVATLSVWSYAGGATNLVPQVTTNLITGQWESKPENVVSATNVDQYTAQVVFTNDAERTLFVRLIDTSGGDSVPVFRVFGGIAFGDGDAITNWPTSGSGISAAEAGQIATNVLSTATTNSMPLIDFGSGGGWTNLSFSGTGNAITNATAAGDTLTLERGTIEGGGGGGTADPFSSILVEADWTWTNGIYAVGANTSVTNIAITLPDAGTNFASVVVRKFSNLNQLLVVRGTNVVYTLYDDGSTRSFDWWPQYTNWYWRN